MKRKIIVLSIIIVLTIFAMLFTLDQWAKHRIKAVGYGIAPMPDVNLQLWGIDFLRLRLYYSGTFKDPKIRSGSMDVFAEYDLISFGYSNTGMVGG